jgi:hypothetical protein
MRVLISASLARSRWVWRAQATPRLVSPIPTSKRRSPAKQAIIDFVQEVGSAGSDRNLSIYEIILVDSRECRFIWVRLDGETSWA